MYEEAEVEVEVEVVVVVEGEVEVWDSGSTTETIPTREANHEVINHKSSSKSWFPPSAISPPIRISP